MKIKIRVAVAANSNGEWNAYGYPTKMNWETIMDAFERLDNEQRFWVEAEIEVPDQPPTFQAEAVTIVAAD